MERFKARMGSQFPYAISRQKIFRKKNQLLNWQVPKHFTFRMSDA